jgi:PiT family inorganic phosphate transporter
MLTCGLVSFFHGQNDGQKGVGIVLMILIAILPATYALDDSVNLQEINSQVIAIKEIVVSTDTTHFGKEEFSNLDKIRKHADHFTTTIANFNFSNEIKEANRFDVRTDVVKITKSAEKLMKSENFAISKSEFEKLTHELKGVKKLVEFAPNWVIIMISICLGLGTMIGWKRIVKTIGEKIGKQHMSYAQGASAELVASIGIAVATGYKVPVSTTHMLSSGIMGSMVAKKGLKNLQRKTIVNILLAWVLTLPVTILLAGSLFLLFRTIL